MGFFKKLAVPPPPPPPAKPRTYTKRPGLFLRAFTKDDTAADGSPIVTRGYRLLSESSGTLATGNKAQMNKAGVTPVSKVAGLDYRTAELQNSAFAVGQRVRLLPDPAEKHDPNAIGVWSEDGTVQVGWIPKWMAADLSPLMRSGDDRAGLVMVEHQSAGGQRLEIGLLVAPPHVVDFLLAKLEG